MAPLVTDFIQVGRRLEDLGLIYHKDGVTIKVLGSTNKWTALSNARMRIG